MYQAINKLQVKLYIQWFLPFLILFSWFAGTDILDKESTDFLEESGSSKVGLVVTEYCSHFLKLSILKT